MANPNIVNVVTINGNTAVVGPVGTSGNVILSNAVSSATVYKVDNLVITNISANTASFNVMYSAAAAGAGANTYLAYQFTVPPSAAMIVVDKSTAFYLTENTSVIVQANTASTLHAMMSYEQIS